MRKILLLLFFATALCGNLRAIDFDCDNSRKWSATFKAGISQVPTWELELGAAWRPVRYAGVAASLMLTNEIGGNGATGTIDGKRWELDTDRCHNVAFRAEVPLTTPAIKLNSDDVNLAFRLSPGITMPVPTNKSSRVTYFPDVAGSYVSLDQATFKNHNATVCYWHLRCEFVLEMAKRWEITAGYTASNLDIYGGTRNTVVHGVPLVTERRQYLHSASLGIAYRF